jgi:hypothetical protein
MSDTNAGRLNLDPNYSDADAFYAALTDLYRDRDDQQAERINARLILLLSNHIGDLGVLRQAISIAGDIEG